jgi:hypothetical protein
VGEAGAEFADDGEAILLLELLAHAGHLGEVGEGGDDAGDVARASWMRLVVRPSSLASLPGPVSAKNS